MYFFLLLDVLCLALIWPSVVGWESNIYQESVNQANCTACFETGVLLRMALFVTGKSEQLCVCVCVCVKLQR